MSKIRLFLLLALGLFLPGHAAAQQTTFEDPLLDHLQGQWVLRGTVMGKETTHDIKAEWVLEHQYLMFKETSREKNAQGDPAYVANVYIGWDQPTKKYVCVWLDDYGDISTQSLGHAKASGNVLAFVFKELTGNGTFETKFSYDKTSDTWNMNMDAQEGGKTSPFARTKWVRD